jgi:hypothetical protein
MLIKNYALDDNMIKRFSGYLNRMLLMMNYGTCGVPYVKNCYLAYLKHV